MKPWENPERFQRWSVFEKEARMNPEDDMVIFGSYQTQEEANEAAIKYGFVGDNYYVKQHDVRY